jgi:DNA adenine methylase
VAFKAKDQIALAECAIGASKRDITVVISNHNTDFTRNLYHRSKITSFPVRRSISCKGDARASVQELLAVFGASVTSKMVIS